MLEDNTTVTGMAVNAQIYNKLILHVKSTTSVPMLLVQTSYLKTTFKRGKGNEMRCLNLSSSIRAQPLYIA